MEKSSGIEATLNRKAAGFYSNPDWRHLGKSLRHAMSSKRADTEIHEGLWLLSTIPMNAEILEAFSNLKIEMLGERFLCLRISESRMAWVFNPLHTLPPEFNRSILDFLRDPVAQKEFIAKLLPTARIPRNMGPLTILGKLSRPPPMIFASQSSSRQHRVSRMLGSHSEIDMTLSKGWISKKTPRRPNVSATYPEFFGVLNAFHAARPATRTEVRKVLTELRRRPSTAPVTDNDQVATEVFFGYYEEEIPGEPRLESSSHHRYMQEVPYLISVLSDEAPLPKSLNSYQVVALGILRKWSNLGRKIDHLLCTTGRSQTATLQNLVGLTAARRWFGFDSSYPDLTEVSHCGTKVILIVLCAGRRVRCIRDVRPKNFRVSPEGRIDLWIESTKVKGAGKKWFPISGILPDDDLDFLLRWRRSLTGENPICGVSGLENRSLIALAAGISDEKLFEERKFHSVAASALKSFLKRKQWVNTHDPRRIFANWFPIRVLIQDNPSLFEHPLIEQNIPAEYLSASARARLSEIMAAKEFEDPLIAATALMGNLSTKQVRGTYCRMWAIWMQLRSDLLQGAV